MNAYMDQVRISCHLPINTVFVQNTEFYDEEIAEHEVVFDEIITTSTPFDNLVYRQKILTIVEILFTREEDPLLL